MESSSEEELEDDFPGHEWITPQSSIRAAYQSQTEKVVSVLLPSQPPSPFPFLDFLPCCRLLPPKHPIQVLLRFLFLS
jgi:hypothetical protein